MSLSDQLFQLLHDIGHLGVEFSLIGGACLVLILGLFRVPIHVVKLSTALVLLSALWNVGSSSESLFGEMVESSRLSWAITKIMVLISMALLIFKTSPNQRSSYYFILLITLAGAIWMMHARHFLLIYLAVEMVSYGSYLMTNFSFEKKAHEAGIKYLLFGGVCSAIMLFGISMLYGVNGHLFLTYVSIDSSYAKMGAVLFLVGVLFKVSAAPFHTWVPNVYQAAPADATAFISIVPKLSALILLQLVLHAWTWLNIPVIVFGLLSIAMGTFGAIKQTNLRRLVSYGAIAHTGFLMAFILFDLRVEGFVLYAAIYALMNVVIFYAIASYENLQCFTLEDIKGSGNQNPILGVSITIALLSLIGLPPTAGFTSKWILFAGIWEQYQFSWGQWAFVYLLISVFATAIALYYYLRPTYFLFLIENEHTGLSKVSIKPIIVLILLSFCIIGLFMYPQVLEGLY